MDPEKEIVVDFAKRWVTFEGAYTLKEIEDAINAAIGSKSVDRKVWGVMFISSTPEKEIGFKLPGNRCVS